MTDLKPTVALTSCNSENMSRHQMIEWVNNMVNGQYKKIEELCSGKPHVSLKECKSSKLIWSLGVAYCQMMDMIFPNCINLKRVKMSAKLEHECFHNMKLFQGALICLKLDKTIPVDRLIKGRFQDNFEFLQWFKKFIDSQAPGLENCKSVANAAQPKPIKPHGIVAAASAADLGLSKKQSLIDLQTSIEELNARGNEVMNARDQAYHKLRQIEILLTESIQKNEFIEFCKRVCDVLYKTDDVGASKDDSNDSNEAN